MWAELGRAGQIVASLPTPPVPLGQQSLGCAEQQPDPLEEAAAAAISHQPASPSAGQRAHPLLRLAAGEPPLAPLGPTHTAQAVAEGLPSLSHRRWEVELAW